MDFRSLLRNESVRNVSTLVAGTGIAQAIAIGVSPILSRIFSPEDFGFWALFISITGIFGVIAGLRYEMAIVLPSEDEDARAVLWLSVFINIIISLLLLMAVVFFGGAFSAFFEIESFRNWLYLTPISVFCVGLFNSFNYWTTRRRRFRLNSGARITQSFTTAGVNLGVGAALKGGSAGLILGHVIGVFSSALYFVLRSLKLYPELRKQPPAKSMFRQASKYRSFALINTPHAFVSTMQDSGIVFVIKYFFTTTILGSYSFAFRILKAPVALVGSAVFQVFYEKASKAVASGAKVSPLMYRLHKNLLIVGLPPFLLLFIFAPDIFAFVFSEPYRQAGHIAQIFTPWIFLNFLLSPVSGITLVKNKQKGAFMITLVDFVFRIVAITYGGITENYMLAFVLMSASCSIVLIFALIWYYRIADSNTGHDAYRIKDNL